MLASPLARPAERPFVRSLTAALPLELRRALRNRRYLMIGIALPVMLYFVFASSKDGAAAAASDRVGFMVAMAVFGGIGAALGGAALIAQECAAGWTRQLRVTPLDPTALLVTKLAVSFLVTIPAFLAIGAAALTVNHLSLTAAEWATTFATLAVGIVPFAVLGLAIGYCFDVTTTQPASMVAYMGLAILGGIWMPIDKLPGALQTAAQAAPSYHLASLARSAAAGSALDPVDFAILAAYGVGLGALVAWRFVRSATND